MTTSSSPSSAPDRAEKLLRAGLLAAAAALLAWGIGWGLPAPYSWAPDELTPDAVEAAAARRFGGGWHDKYPPLHFAVLALLEPAGPALLPGLDERHARALAGRAVSVAMGLGTLALAWAVTRRSTGRDAAPFAVVVLAASVPFVYGAKVANADVPYLFWSAAALLFLLRGLQGGRTRDLVLFAVSAAAALATKDQAYGLFVLPTLLLLRRRGKDGRRALLLASSAGVAAYLLLANVLFNPSGFVEHLRLITGTASRAFRMFPATPAGEARLLVETVRHLGFVLGWPALAAAAWAIATAARRGSLGDAGRALLLAAGSYVLTFLCVVLYVYDRFLLPVALVVAPFAGRGLADAWRSGPAGRLAAGLVVAWCVARGIAVDALMTRDGRYATEAWLRANVPSSARAAAVGPLEYLPRLDGLAWRRMGPARERLERVAPDYVIVNADYAQRSDPGTPDHAFYAGLEDGSLGYERAFAYRYVPRLSPLPSRDLQRQDAGKIFSNLDKVNPEIRVYRRRGR